MNRRSLTYAAIRGLINGALLFLPAYCIVWLVLGNPPVFWQVFLVSEGVELAIRLLLWHRKRRDIRDLKAAYEQPAYGDQ